MLIFVLLVFGLALGSFVNALVWRLRQQETGNRARDTGKKELSPKSYILSPRESSILKGRSMCPNCRHELAVKDLIPVLSWLSLRGRCRYCRQPISRQYPLVELGLTLVFISLYIWWPADPLQNDQKLLFITWLVSSVGLVALLVYDFRWQLLPNRIIYPTLAVALAGRLTYISFFSHRVVFSFELLVFSLLIASGLFWLLFELSKGQWIGFGDVRLGLITGTLLADPKLSFLMLFLASLLGILALLGGLLVPLTDLNQAGNQFWRRKIAFGPFLIIAAWLVVLFGQHLIDWYQRLLT